MKGFIKVTQTNNQGSYLNISHIIRIDKTAVGTAIFLIEGEKIETKIQFDEIKNLINNAVAL